MDGEDHRPESIAAVPGEGGVAVSYVAPGRHASALAITLLVSASLVFSTGAMFIRNLDDSRAWTTVFWRSLAACPSLLLWIWRTERRNTVRAITRMGRPGVAVGLSFTVSSIAMVVALTKTSTAIVEVIFALGPLAAAIMAWVLIGERVRNYTWAAIGVTVAGVAYMVSDSGGRGSATGVLVAMMIPIAFGYGTVMIRRHSTVAMAPAMLLSTVLSTIVAAPFAHPFDITAHDLVLLIIFGFAQLGVGLALFSLGAARAPATDVALLSMLEPVTSPIWVWIFMSEYPGVSALIGGSVVFVALAAHTLYAARRETERVAVPELSVAASR